MKGVSCLVLVTLIASYATAQDIVPVCEEGVTYYPHPTNCNWYYVCSSSGVPVINACLPELWWNTATNLCEDPSVVDCTPVEATTTITTPEPTTTEPITTTTTEDPTTTTEEPTTTTEEPATTTEEPTTTTEEPTTTTEEPTTTTEEPTTTEPIPTTTAGPATEPPAGLPDTCPEEDIAHEPVLLPHPTSCDDYYLCQEGTPRLRNCQNNHHFSPTVRECHPINEAGCDRCPHKETEGVKTRLPHETDCHQYYLCVDLEPVLFQCRTDDEFSRNVRDCLKIAEAKCTL